MSALQSLPITEMLQRGSIHEVDVLRLKSAFHHDSAITADEAEALFALNETCQSQHSTWDGFYVEALTDYVVAQVLPEGYLTADEANRFFKRIASEGLVERKTDLDLLINVLTKSRWSPVSLSCAALNQVKHAVTTGSGPLRAAYPGESGTIRESEVELVRRILYAFGGDGAVPITQAEADVLFEINEQLCEPQANAAWMDLFVKALTNVAMACSGQAVPTREESLRRDPWLMEATGELSQLALLSAMVSSSLKGVRSGYREQSSEERALMRLEMQRIEIITNEEIVAADAAWLCGRIGRRGRLTASEAALVAYLSQESRKIHPELQATVQRLAEAA
ncbi:hypothetical protein [Hyphomicrobium sp. D-2]|uniref:hypothetical protein n=1 Tax=Hyphomicrobium sp. D-2 TaxID=3041621 RepID=UPI0024575940|nr:hypothetical protein [Hyphomicrobium sp. D-2]MDH4982935.1 hypothetical protein [Hyphomicrobium sp. D-2]